MTEPLYEGSGWRLRSRPSDPHEEYDIRKEQLYVEFSDVEAINGVFRLYTTVGYNYASVRFTRDVDQLQSGGEWELEIPPGLYDILKELA
jgi:hypothetical protein